MPIPSLWIAALFAASLAHAAPQPPAFRLGDVATPIEYAASLAIDPREARFSGEVRITLRVNRATPLLWLNATNLAIESAAFQQGNRKIPVTIVPGGEDFVGFQANGADFVPGVALATIRYTGILEPVSTRGLFRQPEGGEWYVVSQFEAISARRAFPCFDEPGWKTPWRLTIDAPAADVVVSNTPETRASAAPARAGWTRHEFAPTKPLPSYLVALAVGPFDVIDGGTAGAKHTRLRYFTPKGRGAEVRFAIESTPRLLEILEEYFGMPYPFEKLDSVSIPQTVGFGAMENPGVVTYAGRLLLATPREETLAFQRRYAAVGAHELAHMWFGDLVTLAWWDDIWLNEAFASWMGDKAAATFRPEWDRGNSVGWLRRSALELDRLASARRVRNPVVEKNDLFGAFDAITYNKGAAVLSMFEARFTPERFRQGVRSFLKRHAWGTATSADFFRALGEASGRSREALEVFRGFVQQPGVPLVDVALDCSKGASLRLSQERLRPVGSSAAEVHWTTPACFRHGSQTQCADIGNGAQTVALEAQSCPAWLVANPGGKSYYVPRYEASLARALRANAGELSPNEMVAHSVDAGVLSESGLLPIGEALAWADAALSHPAPMPRQHGLQLLHRQRDVWLSPAEVAAKRDVTARRVRPLAAELGWTERAGESDEIRELRASVLSYAASFVPEEEKLRAQAHDLALAWLANREAVPATLTRAVLDTAARFADEKTYGALEQALLTNQDLRDRQHLVSALVRVRDEKLRERALALMLRSEVSGNTARDLLENALGDEINRGAAFDFLREHFDPLVAKLPQHSMTWMMGQLGEFCTKPERERFAAFFKERAAQFLGGPRQYRQALERIDLCIAAHNHS